MGRCVRCVTRCAELKKSLYHVFSQFGNILEVVAQKTYKLRGQAWIIFEDLSGATKALKMEGFNFYGKPMKVGFAKAKSDVVSKADGSFVPRPKRKLDTKGTTLPASPYPRVGVRLCSSTQARTHMVHVLSPFSCVCCAISAAIVPLCSLPFALVWVLCCVRCCWTCRQEEEGQAAAAAH